MVGLPSQKRERKKRRERKSGAVIAKSCMKISKSADCAVLLDPVYALRVIQIRIIMNVSAGSRIRKNHDQRDRQSCLRIPAG